MSTANDLQNLADLAALAAHEVLDRLLRLGPRPTDSSGAMLWDQTETRLRGQMNSLTALASKLSASAILIALKGAHADLSDIKAATDQAKRRIAEIKEVSEFLTGLARVLDLGLAVLTLAAAPSPATALALKKAAEKLLKETSDSPA